MTYFIVNMAVAMITMSLYKYIFTTTGFFDSVVVGVMGILLFKLFFGGYY